MKRPASIKHRYIITVRNKKGEYEYVFKTANNKDEAYSRACAEFGFTNIGGVYVDDNDEYALANLKLKRELNLN